MIVTHISSRDVVVIFAEAEGGDRSAPLRQCHHIDSLSRLGIPDEDHWFETDLPGCDASTVRADCKSDDVITMSEFTLSLLLASLDELLTTTEYLLSSLFWVQDDAKSGCHVNTFII